MPNTACTHLRHAFRAVRQLAWLGVGSVKVASSRPGSAPGWFPFPPRRIQPVEITSG